jgi:hypothetical protein
LNSSGISAAILSRGKPDVLEVTIASGLRWSEIDFSSARFASKSSTIASITQSASFKRVKSGPNSRASMSDVKDGSNNGAGSIFFNRSIPDFARPGISKRSEGIDAFAK